MPAPNSITVSKTTASSVLKVLQENRQEDTELTLLVYKLADRLNQIGENGTVTLTFRQDDRHWTKEEEHRLLRWVKTWKEGNAWKGMYAHIVWQEIGKLMHRTGPSVQAKYKQLQRQGRGI